MTDTDDLPSRIYTWRDVLLRLEQLTRNDQGATVVAMRLLVVRGQPAYWFEPKKCKVEPAAVAQAFCEALDMGTSNG